MRPIAVESASTAASFPRQGALTVASGAELPFSEADLIAKGERRSAIPFPLQNASPWLCLFVVLGMVIESLEDLAKSDPGFFTILGIEALHEVLEQHGLPPGHQMQPSPEETIAMAREELP